MSGAPMAGAYPRGKAWLGEVLRHSATAWLVLAVLLMVTALAWRTSDVIVTQRAVERFNFRVVTFRTAIERRMLVYESMLSGGVGLFRSADSVDRGRWHTYVQSLRIESYFPGVLGVGFSKVIAPGDLAAHTAAVRAEGFPQYDVHPKGKRETYTSIIYLEPFSGRNRRAFGYDMFSDPVRRAAMERARDTGEPAMSGMVTLVQETDADVQNGFLIYLPLYRKGMPTDTVERRRAALEGFVYSPFRIKDLMRGILGNVEPRVGLEIFDGLRPSSQTLLYSDDGNPQAQLGARGFKSKFSSVSEMRIGGHSWTLHIYSRPEFRSVSGVEAPTLIAATGIVIDGLVFALLYSLARRQRQVETIAEAMTVQLREKNRELESFTEILAHHLQEPVRLQISFASRLRALLAQDSLTPEVDRAIGYVVRGAERLRMLLRDVQLYLALSQSPWHRRPCDANRALDAALKRLEAKTASTNATITRETLPTVMIDPGRLEDVFFALIDNSLTYARDGTAPAVKIVAERQDAEVTITVEDNGIGIPDRFRDRVFNVFERLHPQTAAPGTGIGLALVRKIIVSAGGTIWIEGAEAGGTRVAFRLSAKD